MSPPPSPSGDPEHRRVSAGLIALLAVLAVLRLVAAGATPLTEDEAYYRLWAQHLRFGYYDHPPMIAWWIWAGQHLAGDTPLGLRLLPVMASLLTTLLVFALGRRGGNARTGLTAAILYNATLTVGAGAILAIPDVPASLFWILTLWCVVRALDYGGVYIRPPPKPPGNGRWWIAAGAAAGLACLSKYSALFLAPGLLLWLALVPHLRSRLKTPWPWLAAAVALAIFSVNVVWNADHHWLTFAKQFGRVAPSRFAPRYLGELIGVQFLLLNPAVAVLAAAGAVRALKSRGMAALPLLYAATSAPFAAYLVLHSLHDRVQAHWPVPLYASAALLAAGAADAPGWRKRLARVAPIGIALTALVLGYAALPRGVIGKGDPADQLRGWAPFTAQIDGVRQAHGAAWIGTLSYGVDAQLRAQQAIAAPVLQLNERDRYADLPDTPPDLAKPGLVVDLQRRVDLARLRACFTTVGPATEINRGVSQGADGRYLAVPVAGPKPDLLQAGCGA